MNFKQANIKLQKIASGEYCSIEYSITNFSADTGGNVEQKCGLYISGVDWFYSNIWEGAFLLLENALKIKGLPEDIEDIEEFEVIDAN